MKTVSLPKEISALFSDAHDNFPAIIGKPSNDVCSVFIDETLQPSRISN